jgi:hypothetical protein
MENTYTKVADLGGRAKHSQLGEVNLLSKWTNNEGHVLHRVMVLSDDTIRYTDLSKGGA